MEGDKLSNDIMVAHLKGGGLSSVSDGLGGFSNGGELIDLISLSNPSPFPDDHMRADLRSLPDDHPSFDDSVRPDFNPSS
jgi:hypothetical protein